MAAPAGRGGVRAFHRRLPGYAPTPLRSLPGLARELGLGALLLKDESSRLGLPAFKILGASWATYCALVDRLGAEPGWASLADLHEAFAPLRPLALATATDGNHGRAVARAARWFGLDARIFVPRGTAAARIAAIESEGATVHVVDGSYDDAVACAAAEAGARCLVISDTGWEGYAEVPARVIEGYSTIFDEVDEELDRQRAPAVDLVMAQIGVGALAAAMVYHYRAQDAGTLRPARIVGVEPEGAACALESAEAGHLVTVAALGETIMAGLNCGTPSLVAWPAMLDGIDCFLAIDDARAEEAVRRLADEGIVSGETGASGLAGLVELLTGPGAVEARGRLGVGRETSALVVSTEGATDPATYARIAGRPATEVAPGEG